MVFWRPKLDITTVRHMSQFTVNVWYLHLAQHKKTTKQQQPAPLRGGKSGPPLRGWWPGWANSQQHQMVQSMLNTLSTKCIPLNIEALWEAFGGSMTGITAIIYRKSRDFGCLPRLTKKHHFIFIIGFSSSQYVSFNVHLYCQPNPWR